MNSVNNNINDESIQNDDEDNDSIITTGLRRTNRDTNWLYRFDTNTPQNLRVINEIN